MSEPTPEHVTPILSRISFLGGISEGDLGVIFKYMESAHYEAGDVITKQGEEPSHIYIIERGVVDLLITVNAVTGKKRSFEVGDSFGEAAMLSLINHTATFVAAQPADLWLLSRRNLNALRMESPVIFSQLILNLARDLARKLQYTDELLLVGGLNL